MPSLLIVDDLVSIHEMLGAVIQPIGYELAFATDGEKGLATYKAGKFDVVLADIDMKPMDGLTLLKNIKEFDASAVVIIMTAYASTESAIQALKYGAFDYLQKPFKVDELLRTLKRAVEFRQSAVEREATATTAGVPRGDLDARFPGESAKIKRVVAQLRKLAAAQTPVLITGERGTGHEIAAELLHAAGHGPDKPMIFADCRLTSPETVRRNLLGVNGAGGEWATQAKGGVLVLEHPECLDPEAQNELVSVLRNNLQNFRLICTTEADLERLADEGKFNEELFFRIAPLPVHLPPLRERSEDLPALLREICTRTTNPQFDVKQIEFTHEAMAVLRAYQWPGNLAELNQVISQIATTTTTRVIGPEQLPLRLHELDRWPRLADYLARQEKSYIAQVLHACQGDRKRAAMVLGIDEARLG
jgi:two-component system, NtrC family, response regulator HydG